MFRNHLVALLFVAGLLWPFTAARAATSPGFIQMPCDLPGVSPALANRLRCGTVAVPVEPDVPGGTTIRLAVVIIAPVTATPRPDPVLYIAGGPGSPLTSRAAVIALREADVLARDRDLILVDQRGVDRSEPALCAGLSRQQLSIFAAGAPEPALVEAWRRTYDACHDAMLQAGQDPAWFGTQITAADLEAVRKALKIERWNVYALSYGTSVAMTMQALYPDSLRAVVLDSVLPVDPPLPPAETFGRALNRLFDACRADPDCAASFPDLATAYHEAIERLDADPLAVPLPPGLGRSTFDLRAEAFRLIVDRSLYSRPGMAVLPAFITAARDHRADLLQRQIVAVSRGYATLSTGAMAAVDCRDRPELHVAAAGPPVDAFVAGMCRAWTTRGPPPLLPHDAAMPTLLLAGQLDPITPPELARAAAAAIGKHATIVEFANTGHGAAQASTCAESIVRAFLHDPLERFDPACAAHVPDIAFAFGAIGAR